MRHRTLSILFSLAALGLLVGPLADRASAQYFGQNKVQYEDFDWQVLETEHFDIYFYEDEREAAIVAGRMAERWYARISRVLDHEIQGRQPIVLYADHPDFEQTNAVFGQIGESTGGLTEPLKRRIVLPLGATLKESDHVLGHELVHAFQFDVAGIRPDAVSRPAGLRAPLWFIEGMAEYISIGSTDPFTGMWMRGAVQDSAMPDWGDLSNQREYFPYRYGHALWSYVGGRWGDDVVAELLKRGLRARSLKQAFSTVLGVQPDTLIADWRAATREVQEPVLEAARPPGETGRELMSEEKSGTQQNLGPSLSPNGDLMVFASEKNLFSIEFFVADAETGEVVRKLTETARDPHFESLQWLKSTGAWSPDGDRFALGAVTKGTPVIVIYDPRTGEKLREIKVRQVGEIFNPTWSPDGSKIAFSAQDGGFTDLFVMDVESGEVRRLTDDRFSDIHPAWAPDGSVIVEVTDRYGNNVDRLQFDSYRLALVDPASGEREMLPGFEGAKHINPQWGPDGRSIYFVSDQDGVSNLYRLDRDGGEIHRVTNLQTGISGISALSPAVSVARAAPKAAITVHGEGSFVFDIYTLEGEQTLAGEPVVEGPKGPLAGLSPALLPPEERSLDRVNRLLADADLGLADPVTFQTHDYDPSLSLDFIGRPNLAVGTNEFGFFAGGGGSAFFSDMLGNQNLSTLAQISSSGGELLYSSAAFGTYLNRGGRWDWGVRGGQIPVIDRLCCALTRAPVEEGGDREALAFRDIRFWQINRQVQGLLEYPFHRSLRLEFSAGARNTDFAAKERLLFLDRFGQVAETRDRTLTVLDTISSINTAMASAALVYDNTVFGATAPMLGQRYRFEVAPQAGDIFYATALADYRRYFMPVRPFTLAFRGMHIGRYGEDSDDFRLSDYFLGSPGIVRGYDFGFGDLNQCGQRAGGVVDCDVTQRLTGSRIAVFNAEVRLPFLGGIGIIPVSNFPPVDLLAFFDAGSAWNGDLSDVPTGPFQAEQDPDVDAFEEETIFKSAGVGARVNVFGLAVVEVDYVRAFDRIDFATGEEGDWVWDFSVTPGF